MRGKFLQGRPRPLPRPIFFTRMLMRDLFDVANLLVYIRFMVANVVRFYAIALVFLNLYPTVICEI